MAISREQLERDLKFDIDRLPIGIEEKASEGAIDVLDELDGATRYLARVSGYARRHDVDAHVPPNDLLRTLQRADGRLALVTWSSGGITSVGYLPDAQRFDVGSYSAVQDLMGNEAESYEKASRRSAKDMIAGSKPDVVLRDEADLLPALEEVEVVA